MEVKKNLSGDVLELQVIGRLDTSTAPQLEAIVSDLSGVKTLVLNFQELEYISSAGLRVVLGCMKTMNKQGNMTIKNVNDTVMEVFEITGFADLLNIE